MGPAEIVSRRTRRGDREKTSGSLIASLVLAAASCINISADSMLLASTSLESNARIRQSLDTRKLVAGPFRIDNWPGAIRFSQDLKKLAVRAIDAGVLKCGASRFHGVGDYLAGGQIAYKPVFCTMEDRATVFRFTGDSGQDVRRH